MARWQVRLSGPAERDFAEIIAYTSENFGPRQARAYQSTLKKALSALHAGPRLRDSVSRDEIEVGLRSLHVARNGRRGRHVIVYSEAAHQTIEVKRILHDAMDLARHMPQKR